MTLTASHRSVFDALSKAAKRRGQSPRLIESGRTFIAEFDDVSFLEPFCGTHRVQRIPKGSSARHTSTATIAILDHASEAFELDEADLDEQFTRGSGPGGQHRNKVETTVVLTHVPSGVSVRCDGRSQWQNRQDARAELVRRMEALAHQTAREADNAERKRQVSSVERPAKSFTYNTQRDEVVDHSTGKKWRMSAFMKGRF